MKRLVVLMMIAVFSVAVLAGCAASTLSRTAKDGAATLILKNYVLTETIFCADGKTVCFVNTMVPADSIMKGALEKIMEALKSAIGVVNIPVDAVKTVAPAVIK